MNVLRQENLTAESTDFLADEFGEMIRNFKQFQRKLRGTISTALKAAMQLSSSAHELAITSSKMSDSAQAQAASVEEASASLEEVSGSIELININAQEQANLAKATFSAMEQLRSDNVTVAGYAEKALEAARGTTEQAGNGQQLMYNTIEGMNNIDESTKKIADTVRLISDISDQVIFLLLTLLLRQLVQENTAEVSLLLLRRFQNLLTRQPQALRVLLILSTPALRKSKRAEATLMRPEELSI